MIIAIDFDGTCVTHDFPEIGEDIGAVPVLKALVNNGHKLILFTMRSDVKEPRSYDKEIIAQAGMYLSDVLIWFEENGITLWGVQINPEQHEWTTSNKAYAQLYIDDAALGCPLIHEPKIHSRPFADWQEIENILIKKGLIITRDSTITANP